MYQSRHDNVLSLQFCVLKDKTTEFSLGLFTFDFKNAFWSIRSQFDSETRCECKQAKRCTRMNVWQHHSHFSGSFQRSKVLTLTRLWWDRHFSTFWQKWQTPQQNDTSAGIIIKKHYWTKVQICCAAHLIHIRLRKTHFKTNLKINFLLSYSWISSTPPTPVPPPSSASPCSSTPHLHLPASSPPRSSFGWG